MLHVAVVLVVRLQHTTHQLALLRPAAADLLLYVIYVPIYPKRGGGVGGEDPLGALSSCVVCWCQLSEALYR